MMMFLFAKSVETFSITFGEDCTDIDDEPESSVSKHCTNREFPSIRLNRIFRFFHAEISDDSCSGLLSTLPGYQL